MRNWERYFKSALEKYVESKRPLWEDICDQRMLVMELDVAWHKTDDSNVIYFGD